MRNRILVVDGHPDPSRERFCHALADAYVEGARSAGLETRLVTVSEIDIPFLRTAAEFAAAPTHAAIGRAREDLLWCNHLVLVFPLWLGGAPTLLRGFFEQVARGEFVAQTSGRGTKKNLTGRSARLIVTMGMPAIAYRLMFHEHGVRDIMQGVLRFGGIAPIRRTLFGPMDGAGKAAQKTRLETTRRLGRDGG